MDMLLSLVPLLALAGYVGWFAARQAFCGGWEERRVHSCGWFVDFAVANILYPGHPCPRCGEKDNNWTTRIGRPVFPFGWEWKENQTSAVHK